MAKEIVRFDPDGNVLPKHVCWQKPRHYVIIRSSETNGFKKISAPTKELALKKLRLLRERNKDISYYATLGIEVGKYRIKVRSKQLRAADYEEAIKKLITELAKV